VLIEVGDAETQAQSIVNVAGGVISTTSVLCAIAVILRRQEAAKAHPARIRHAGSATASTLRDG
jgi:hypothetical protein